MSRGETEVAQVKCGLARPIGWDLQTPFMKPNVKHCVVRSKRVSVQGTQDII